MNKDDLAKIKAEFQSQYDVVEQFSQDLEKQKEGMGCAPAFILCQKEGKIQLVKILEEKFIDQNKRIKRSDIEEMKRGAQGCIENIEESKFTRLHFNCQGIVEACEFILKEYYPIKEYKPQERTIKKQEWLALLDQNEGLVKKTKWNSIEYCILQNRIELIKMELSLLKKDAEFGFAEQYQYQKRQELEELSVQSELNYTRIEVLFQYIQKDLQIIVNTNKKIDFEIKVLQNQIIEKQKAFKEVNESEKMEKNWEIKDLIHAMKKKRLDQIENFVHDCPSCEQIRELKEEAHGIFAEIF
jgi:hypothetical protein